MKKMAGAITSIVLFLWASLTAIFFLLGLAFINYAIYLWELKAGLTATGASLILVALILNYESDGR